MSRQRFFIPSAARNLLVFASSLNLHGQMRIANGKWPTPDSRLPTSAPDTFCHSRRRVLSRRQLVARVSPQRAQSVPAEKKQLESLCIDEKVLIALWPAACHYVKRATGQWGEVNVARQLKVGECLGGGARAEKAPDAGPVPFIFSPNPFKIV